MLDNTHTAQSSPETEYNRFKSRKEAWIIAIAGLCVAIALVSLAWGDYTMTLSEVIHAIFHPFEKTADKVAVWDLRLPRICAAILVGCSLAVAGTVMQCILRNPLASPYTLGVSNAAAVGAALAIAASYMGWFIDTPIESFLSSTYGMALSAFLFAMVAVAVVIAFSRRDISPETMVLAGVAIGSIFSAILSSLQYFVDDQTLSAIVFWQFGDLSKAAWSELAMILVIFIPTIVYFIWHRMDYNAVEAGVEVASSLGVDTRKLMIRTMILSSMLAAVCVSIVGIIGFVGLLGPHIMRRLIGGDHRFLIIGSMVMGVMILLLSDVVGRIPFESPLPVGIITSFLGGPLFLYMLVKKVRRTTS